MQVSVVIPAFNEKKRIGDVLDPLTKSSLITEIIVVDDGSNDDTFKVVEKYKDIILIKLSHNRGKGQAIKEGLGYCRGEIILLIDADLIGLTTQHIEYMLEPLIYTDIEMTIGIFQSGRLVTDLAQRIAPYLSGQRAFKKNLLNDIMQLNMKGYNVEIALSRYIKNKNINTKFVFLKNISHVMKEEKLGFGKGLMYRVGMYIDIVRYWLN